MRIPRHWAVAISFLGAVGLAPGARAEDVAETLWIQGLADMEAGRYDKGCPAIEESFRLDPRPGTLFTLAECERKRGRISTALSRYQEYLAQYKTFTPVKQREQSERAQISKQQVADLTPRVPKLVLRVRAVVADDLEIVRDGKPVALASLGLALPIDPGDHVVTVRRGHGPKTERRFSVIERETKEIDVDSPADPAPAPTGSATTSAAVGPAQGVADPAAARRSAQRSVAIAGGALGVAGLVVGTVSGIVAIEKRSVVNAHCPTFDTCDEEGLVASATAKQMATLSTIGFAAGLVGVVAGGVLWATAPDPTKPGIQAIGVGPNGVLVRGTFRGL